MPIAHPRARRSQVRPGALALLLILVSAGHPATAANVTGPAPGTPAALDRSPSGPAPLLSPTATEAAAPVTVVDDPLRPIDLTAPQFSARSAADLRLGPSAGSVFHVKPVAVGDGSGVDWANASGDLQTMLDAATAGDQVWVAGGVYRPGPSNDRNSSFVLKDGVAVYGGFAGTEGPGFDLGLRDFVANPTILSGDLFGDDGQQPLETDPSTNTNTADNAFTVVNASGVGAGTLLDGFTITAGRADLLAPSPAASIRGAGIYLNTGTLTVGNCRFVGGKAGIDAATQQVTGGGAGIFALAAAVFVEDCTFTGGLAGQGPAISSSNSSLEIGSSDFVANDATRLGGAIVSIGTLTVRDCTFSDNEAVVAAGTIYTNGIATIERSTFTGNRITQPALTNGGAGIYAVEFTPPLGLTVLDCAFVGNVAVFGAGITSWVPATIRRSSFEGNFVKLKGGAIQLQEELSESVVDSCTFTNNTAGDGIENQGSGGAINVTGARLLVANSTFTGNAAVNQEAGEQESWGGGGALSIYSGGQALVTITGCEFIENGAASSNGGAILSMGSYPNIADCLFRGNAANYWGGAVCSNRDANGAASGVTATDCRFEGNAAKFGGGIMTWFSSAAVNRVVFDGNVAGAGGGGLSVSFDGTTTVTNSLFLNNTAPQPGAGGAGLLVTGGSLPVLTNVTMTGNSAENGAAVTQLEANSNATFVNGILYGNPSADGTPFVNLATYPGATGTLSYTLLEEAACPPGATCGAGMIYAADPLFAGPNDLRLLQASPAIDAGTNVGAPATDLAGSPRALTAGDPADMGAYEFFVDCDGNGFADAAELVADPSLDCNANGFLDACETAGMSAYGRLPLSGTSQGISTDGTYAYLVNESANRLDVLDVGDPLAPTVIGTSVGVFGPKGGPRHSVRVDDTLYIGTAAFGLHVFNVSNANSPSLVVSIGGGSGPLAQPFGRFARQGNYLYIPLEPRFSDSPGLVILDITNRSFPAYRGFVATPEIPTQVVVAGNYAYASVRANGANPPAANLYVFDIQSPTSPALIQQLGAPDEARGIAFLGTDRLVTAGATSLKVYDISTPGAPSFEGTSPLPGVGQSIDVTGAVAYVGTASDLLAFDFTDPLAPDLLSGVAAPAAVSQTVLVQDRLVAACSTFGVAVYSPVALDGNGDSIPDVCQSPTAAPSPVQNPFALHPATPNPFSPSTTIRFDLPQTGPAELIVFDLAGRRVRTLVQETRAEGRHEVVWGGVDDGGRRVASGVYLYRLRAGSYVQTGRMTLLK